MSTRDTQNLSYTAVHRGSSVLQSPNLRFDPMSDNNSSSNNASSENKQQAAQGDYAVIVGLPKDSTGYSKYNGKMVKLIQKVQNNDSNSNEKNSTIARWKVLLLSATNKYLSIKEKNLSIVDDFLEDSCVKFKIPNLKGVGSEISLAFNANMTIVNAFDELERRLRLKHLANSINDINDSKDEEKERNNHVLRYKGETWIPRSFCVKVDTTATNDSIDFENNKFIMTKDTRFVQYWNDFRDAIWEFDEKLKIQESKENEKKNNDASNDNSSGGKEKNEEEDIWAMEDLDFETAVAIAASTNDANKGQNNADLRYSGEMNVRLINRNKIIQIGGVSVSFERTLRIPDDSSDYPLPPSLGSFELAKVTDYMKNEFMPDGWKKRKGLILPMWQKEVMLLTPFYLVLKPDY